MDYLLSLGLSNSDISDMVLVNNSILYDEDNIKDNIDILKYIGCCDSIIRNIVTINPIYLSRSKSSIISLINKLSSLGIKNLDITFDTNPFLLNMESYEIDLYIEDNIKKGMDIKDIIDLIDGGMIVW